MPNNTAWVDDPEVYQFWAPQDEPDSPTPVSTTQCRRCNVELPALDMVQCDRNFLCPDCAATVCSPCTACGRRCFTSHMSRGPDDLNYCTACWRHRWSVCNDCHSVTPVNEYETHDGYCQTCHTRNRQECNECGCVYHRNNMHLVDDDTYYCQDCYDNHKIWPTKNWDGVPSGTLRTGSERCFGVEIETAGCQSYMALQKSTTWGCVYECSTSGHEFVSPIMQGDAGLDDIGKICEYAHDNSWCVDSDCGLHIHLDLRRETEEQVRKVAYAYRRTYNTWTRFVSRRRADRSMCGTPQYAASEIKTCEHIEDFCEVCDKFEFVNWRAYINYGSVEIRLHPGTLNAKRIGAWVSLHARFIDAVKDLSFDQIDTLFGTGARQGWKGFCKVIDPELLRFWLRLIKCNRSSNTWTLH